MEFAIWKAKNTVKYHNCILMHTTCIYREFNKFGLKKKVVTNFNKFLSLNEDSES